MKERLSLSISILIAAVLVLIGLTTLSNTIQNRPFAGTPYIPSSIEVTTAQSSEYMSEWEAATYLRIEYDYFIKLHNEGKLNGTFVEIPVLKTILDEQAYAEMTPVPEGAPEPAMPVITVTSVQIVFVRTKLDEWMLAQMAPNVNEG